MEIREKVKSLGLKWIGSQGPANAKIAIVGEAPGAEEERLGLPFIGGAGALLNSLLSQVGIDRAECYVTNVIKVRPPKNDLKLLSTLGLTLEEFLPELQRELREVKPNVVVALGGHALRALCSQHSIMNWRGSIMESTLIAGQKVIPGIHPAAILRNYKWKPLLLLDLKRVKKEMETASIVLPNRILTVEPTLSHTRDYIETFLKSADRLAFDIELGRDGIISCISFSHVPEAAISIPFRKGYSNYWTEGEEYTIWKWLGVLFQGEHRWIAQNALFDVKFLWRKVGYFPIYMDTMWAAQLCYAEIPKGLDTLCSIYTREPYYKDERKVWKDASITRQLYLYNAKDSAVTIEVALRLEEELKMLKMEEFFFGFVMKLFPILLKLEERGMLIDIECQKKLKEDVEREMEKLEASLGGVNVRSTKQMQKLLYEEMGLPKQWNRKTGSVSTGKEALIKLRGKI